MKKMILEHVNNNIATLKIDKEQYITLPYDYIPIGVKEGDKLKLEKVTPMPTKNIKFMSEKCKRLFIDEYM